ncbi:MAG: GAF domain-containing sensor histidine kinase [Actinomycetota bacterium]
MIAAPPPKSEAVRLAALHQLKILDTDPEPELDDLTSMVAFICGTPMAVVSLVDSDRQWFKSRFGVNEVETPREISFCQHAILQRGLFVVPDATLDERFRDSPLVTDGPRIRFYAGAPLLDDDGHALGTLCTMDRVPRELSRQQGDALMTLARQASAHLRLRKAYDNLRKLEELRDSLTHMIVHDLRQPLQSVIGGLETLPLLGDLNAEQREFLELSTEGGQTLLEMINDLLDIGKMESGSLVLERSPVDPRAKAERAMRQVWRLAQEKQLELRCEVPEGGPLVPADREKLRRVLVNLLGNAIKFTPRGGKVTVAGHPDPIHGYRFSVADTGEGIPADAYERIFEKFGQVQSRKEGRVMSTGLGLTFCKMVVEAHGGRIWVESRLGHGSTFSLTLPL